VFEGVSESVSEFEFVFEGGWRERGRVRNPSPVLVEVAREALVPRPDRPADSEGYGPFADRPGTALGTAYRV